MLAACLFSLGLAACGSGGDPVAVADPPESAVVDGEKAASQTGLLASAGSAKRTTTTTTTTGSGTTSDSTTTSAPSTKPAPTTTTTTTTTTASSAIETAVRDMRAGDGTYARNEDRLLHRSLAGYSSQTDRASLAMGRYGTKAAFTTENPDYQAELSWVSMSDPIRYLETWPRLNLWDQVYLSERYGPTHAPGYTGNSRVRTWGYEMWVKSKSTKTWRRLFKSDSKSAEAWRPTFRGSPSFDSTALDIRKEPDGSTSVRPMPAMGFDSTGSYWIAHGYSGGIQTVDPYDVADVLVLCWSQLVLDDPSGTDDRMSARFLFGLGVDWYPPEGMKLSMYPGSGTSRHKYVTVEPRLHVMHTMTESELRANPPPLAF